MYQVDTNDIVTALNRGPSPCFFQCSLLAIRVGRCLGLVRLVGQRFHTGGAERIHALTKLGDAHRLNELEQTLLHQTSLLSDNQNKISGGMGTQMTLVNALSQSPELGVGGPNSSPRCRCMPWRILSASGSNLRCARVTAVVAAAQNVLIGVERQRKAQRPVVMARKNQGTADPAAIIS